MFSNSKPCLSCHHSPQKLQQSILYFLTDAFFFSLFFFNLSGSESEKTVLEALCGVALFCPLSNVESCIAL